jgi:hypothetical protein
MRTDTPAAFATPALPIALGAMNEVEGDALLEAWERCLALQTRLFGPYEVEWLRAHGFGGRVLEIGCAAGIFGSFLARSFPSTRLYGVEANAAFVETHRELPANYSIDGCVLGQDRLPAHIDGRVDQAFLRYVLQHSSHPERILAAAHAALPDDGRLFVVEEDDAFFTSHGRSPAFEGAADAWRRVCAATGTDCGIGRKLPALLARAGFEVERFEIVLRTSTTLGADFFRFFASVARIFHLTRPDVVGAAELRALEAGLARLAASPDDAPVATYPHVLVVARKPARVH